MNDFTKEELSYMAEAVDMWLKGDDSSMPERICLKIQSMIDNYCEHEFSECFNGVRCRKCDFTVMQA